jgi:hypothetical protein
MRGTNRQHAVGHAEDVDAEAPPPVVGLLLPRFAAPTRGDAGVVEEEVARPMALVHPLGEGFHRREVGDVRRDAADVSEG